MLEKLSEVQGFDLQLDALREERAQTPPELQETRERRRDLARRLERKKQERDELRRRVASTDLELKTLQQRRKDASESSLRASSAKEASQYQNQELQFATRVQELEEDALPLMESLETVEQEVDGLQAELDELQPALDAMVAEEDARVAAVDAKSGEVKQRRDALAGSLDGGLLKQYEQVRRARRGLGLVEIVDNQRCGGCSVRLPIHVIQKARRGKSVVRCPSCGRLLWPKDDG
ncbi:MAG TPA: C4-type zinc ribbon domain-containing protein [Trueperaceae bacterium]|nr:C4-type zinc ribbon domain-containing protein [Trueperaceae bacterium]